MEKLCLKKKASPYCPTFPIFQTFSTLPFFLLFPLFLLYLTLLPAPFGHLFDCLYILPRCMLGLGLLEDPGHLPLAVPGGLGERRRRQDRTAQAGKRWGDRDHKGSFHGQQNPGRNTGRTLSTHPGDENPNANAKCP